jgi:hypothetical protein
VEFAIPLAVVVVIVLGVFAALIANARRQAVHHEHTRDADIDLLRYHVPEGHDPAPVIAALQHEGFEVLPDARRTDRHDLLIPCREGKDRHREHVRAVIEGVDAINLEGDPAGRPGDTAPAGRGVRFADE